MFKHLGLVSIVLMWAGTYLLLKNHSFDFTKTISKHASKNAKYHVIFGLLELVVVGLFTVFIFGWFIPTLQLSDGYAIAAVFGLVGASVAAFIPDRAGWQGRLHGIGAYGMALSLLVMNTFLTMSPEINMLTRFVLFATLVYMISGIVIAIIYPSIYKRNILVQQAIYFLSFHIPILLAVYSH